MNWSSPFVWFLMFLSILIGGLAVLCRRIITVICKQVAEHAKLNAQAYIRGFIYVSIAFLSDLKDVFENLSTDVAKVLPWWSWVVLFTTPILGALVTLGAFLDKSAASNRQIPKTDHEK